MALGLATRRAVLAGRRTALVAASARARGSAPAMATDMTRARRPIAGIARAGIPATRAGRQASTTDRATVMTRVIGTDLASHVAVTASAQPMGTATDRKARTETDTRRTAVTSVAGTASAMTSGHRTTTGETATGERTTIQGRLATRIRRMADTAKAGRLHPTVTAATGRTGPTQVLMARTVRSIRLVAVIPFRRIVGGQMKDSRATATVRGDRGSTARSQTGRLTPRRGLVPPIGYLTSGLRLRKCSAIGRLPRCRPGRVRQLLKRNQTSPDPQRPRLAPMRRPTSSEPPRHLRRMRPTRATPSPRRERPVRQERSCRRPW